jgi:hypothetical protein
MSSDSALDFSPEMCLQREEFASIQKNCTELPCKCSEHVCAAPHVKAGIVGAGAKVKAIGGVTEQLRYLVSHQATVITVSLQWLYHVSRAGCSKVPQHMCCHGTELASRPTLVKLDRKSKLPACMRSIGWPLLKPPPLALTTASSLAILLVAVVWTVPLVLNALNARSVLPHSVAGVM